MSLADDEALQSILSVNKGLSALSGVFGTFGDQERKQIELENLKQEKADREAVRGLIDGIPEGITTQQDFMKYAKDSGATNSQQWAGLTAWSKNQEERNKAFQADFEANYLYANKLAGEIGRAAIGGNRDMAFSKALDMVSTYDDYGKEYELVKKNEDGSYRVKEYAKDENGDTIITDNPNEVNLTLEEITARINDPLDPKKIEAVAASYFKRVDDNEEIKPSLYINSNGAPYHVFEGYRDPATGKADVPIITLDGTPVAGGKIETDSDEFIRANGLTKADEGTITKVNNQIESLGKQLYKLTGGKQDATTLALASVEGGLAPDLARTVDKILKSPSVDKNSAMYKTASSLKKFVNLQELLQAQVYNLAPIESGKKEISGREKLALTRKNEKFKAEVIAADKKGAPKRKDSTIKKVREFIAPGLGRKVEEKRLQTIISRVQKDKVGLAKLTNEEKEIYLDYVRSINK